MVRKEIIFMSDIDATTPSDDAAAVVGGDMEVADSGGEAAVMDQTK